MQMKRTIATVLLLTAIVSLWGCGTEESALAEYVEESKSEVPTVEVVQVAPRDFEQTVMGTGSLRANRISIIQPQVSGPLDQLPVDIGDVVKQGDLLAQVRTVNYENEVAQASAALAVANAGLADLLSWRRPEELAQLRAGVRASEATLQMTQTEYKRKQSMLASGGISPAECDRCEEAYKASKANLEVARATLEAATAGPTATQVQVARAEIMAREVALTNARQKLTDCTITAPYDGAITAKFAEVGEEMQNMPPTNIVEISDISTLHASFHISELLVPMVKPGVTGKLKIVSTGEEVMGEVIAVNSSANEQTRTFLVKAAVPNHDLRLKAGLFVRATLSVRTVKGAPSLHRKALRYLFSNGNGGNLHNRDNILVFVVKENGEVEYRRVKLGLEDSEGYMEIVEGLELGEKVVADASLPLVEGHKVKATEQSGR
jgi:RND family efflux transporter MFP subunit